MKKVKLSLKQLESIVSEEIRRGKQPDVLIRELTKRGWSEAAARHFVNNSRRMYATTHQATVAHMNAEAEIANTSDEDKSTEHTPSLSIMMWIFALAGLVAVVFHMLA